MAKLLPKTYIPQLQFVKCLCIPMRMSRTLHSPPFVLVLNKFNTEEPGDNTWSLTFMGLKTVPVINSFLYSALASQENLLDLKCGIQCHRIRLEHFHAVNKSSQILF